jgi:hypothetical protein
MTFSINIDENTESTAYQLTGDIGTSSNFRLLLDILADNDTGDINPVDIRNTILSLWSSDIFKLTTLNKIIEEEEEGENEEEETTTSTTTEIEHNDIPYIGFDTLNPDDNDLKGKKILFGKTEFQSNNILNNELLESEYDIIFYNTKSDNQQQFTTRLNFLSGVNSNNFKDSPFIQSQAIFATTSVSFDFNSNSDIRLSSDRLVINDLNIPNIPISNNQTFLGNSESNSIVFGGLSYSLGSNIGTQSETLDIFGRPIKLNNYSLEFSDNRKSTLEIGDIKLGESFTNFSLSEILKRIVYKYLPPFSIIRNISHPSGYVEIGEVPNVVLEYSIFKRTLNTQVAILLNMIPGFAPAIQTSSYSSITGTSSGLISSRINASGVTFSVTVSDGQQTSVVSTNIRGIFPYYYGLSTKDAISSNELLNLVKLVEDKNDKNIIIQPGSGFFYFIYDNDYGELSEILNENGNQLSENSDFIKYSQILSSPNGLWVNKEFKVYRINNPSNIIPIIYKFKY